MKSKEELTGLVASPDNALSSIKAGLEPFEQYPAIIVTVHEVKSGQAGNVWFTNSKQSWRLIPERVITEKPDQVTLMGEIMRFTRAKLGEIESDWRLKLAVISLKMEFERLEKQSQ